MLVVQNNYKIMSHPITFPGSTPVDITYEMGWASTDMIISRSL